MSIYIITIIKEIKKIHSVFCKKIKFFLRLDKICTYAKIIDVQEMLILRGFCYEKRNFGIAKDNDRKKY